jgi:hypothetical protein
MSCRATLDVAPDESMRVLAQRLLDVVVHAAAEVALSEIAVNPARPTSSIELSMWNTGPQRRMRSKLRLVRA